MNIFDLVNNFFEEDKKSKLSSSAAKLYFFLIYQANKLFWEGPLTYSIRYLSKSLSLNKNTVIKSLKELYERKLITYYPSEYYQRAIPTSIWFSQTTSKPKNKKEVKKLAKHTTSKENKYIDYF
jgi:DNA-binding MarR family transcriptional regulator